MNILQMEDTIKGLSDEGLMGEAQRPTGQVPQYLVISEVQRRADMRNRYQQQQQEQPQGTVADQVIQRGIAGVAPPPPEVGQAMYGGPPQAMNGGPPQAMYGGGVVRMKDLGGVPYSDAWPGGPTRQEIQDQIETALKLGASRDDIEGLIGREAMGQFTGQASDASHVLPRSFEVLERAGLGDKGVGLSDSEYASRYPRSSFNQTAGPAAVNSLNEQNIAGFPAPASQGRGRADWAQAAAAVTPVTERPPGTSLDVSGWGHDQRRPSSIKTRMCRGQILKNTKDDAPPTDSRIRDAIAAADKAAADTAVLAADDTAVLAAADKEVPGRPKGLSTVNDLLAELSRLRGGTTGFSAPDYSSLIAASETREREAMSGMQRLAEGLAIAQLGAGIAAGDLPGGLSKAAEIAGKTKKEGFLARQQEELIRDTYKLRIAEASSVEEKEAWARDLKVINSMAAVLKTMSISENEQLRFITKLMDEDRRLFKDIMEEAKATLGEDSSLTAQYRWAIGRLMPSMTGGGEELIARSGKYDVVEVLNSNARI